MIFVARSLNYNSKFVKQSLPWKIFLRNLVTPALCLYGRPLLFLSLFLSLSKEEAAVDRQPPWSQNLFQQQTDTLWEIKHGGILSQWNHYIPPTLFSCTVGESQWERQNEKELRLSVGLFRSEGARLIGRARTQRASERALVIWSVRQLGLSSETQRGEVGDHVWGPPSCYCP